MIKAVPIGRLKSIRINERLCPIFPNRCATAALLPLFPTPMRAKPRSRKSCCFFSGAIQSAGTVKGKKSGKFATSDWMEIEKQRGISVASSVMQFEYHDHTVNLLDTPGHQDFSEDTYRVLTAVDSALMVIDAAKGVEAQTIKLLNVCRLRNTPIVTFMNKYDREVRDSLELLDEVESVLQIRCAPVTWPIGMGKNFKGVYSILNDEVYLFEAGGEKLPHEFEVISGIDNTRGWMNCFRSIWIICALKSSWCRPLPMNSI